MSESTTAIIVAVIGSGCLTTILNFVLDKIKDRDGSRTASRLIMKDRLRFLCVHYINQGWIYEDELNDLVDMHDCYHNKLGGNGYLDKLMNKVMDLEIRGIGVK